MFGEGMTEDDKVMFAVHISEKLRGNDTVMAQVNNNTGEQALKADLPDAATDAIVEAMGSHEKMATRLLSDEAARDLSLGLLYEILKRPEAPAFGSGRMPGNDHDGLRVTRTHFSVWVLSKRLVLSQ